MNTALGVKFIDMSLNYQESEFLDNIDGFAVIRHGWSDSNPCVCIINSYSKSITYIAGRDFNSLPMTTEWVGEGNNAKLKISSNYDSYSGATNFSFYLIGFRSGL